MHNIIKTAIEGIWKDTSTTLFTKINNQLTDSIKDKKIKKIDRINKEKQQIELSIKEFNEVPEAEYMTESYIQKLIEVSRHIPILTDTIKTGLQKYISSELYETLNKPIPINVVVTNAKSHSDVNADPAQKEQNITIDDADVRDNYDGKDYTVLHNNDTSEPAEVVINMEGEDKKYFQIDSSNQKLKFIDDFSTLGLTDDNVKTKLEKGVTIELTAKGQPYPTTLTITKIP